MRLFNEIFKSGNWGVTHTLFELVSRWSAHQHTPRERLHPEEKHD